MAYENGKTYYLIPTCATGDAAYNQKILNKEVSPLALNTAGVSDYHYNNRNVNVYSLDWSADMQWKVMVYDGLQEFFVLATLLLALITIMAIIILITVIFIRSVVITKILKSISEQSMLQKICTEFSVTEIMQIIIFTLLLLAHLMVQMLDGRNLIPLKQHTRHGGLYLLKTLLKIHHLQHHLQYIQVF